MHVLMFSWEYPPDISGGLGRHVAELAPALLEQDITLHLITPIPEQFLTQLDPITLLGSLPKQAGQAAVSPEKGVMVHRVLAPINPLRNDIHSRVTEVNQLLAAYALQIHPIFGPFHLVHTHDWLTGPAAIALQQTCNIPLVATIHATERGRTRGHLSGDLQWAIDASERSLIGDADRVIVCSRHMFNELHSLFHVPAVKMDVVPNGVTINGYANLSTETRSNFRLKYAQPSEQIVFSVGRLVYEKGMHRLIDAAPTILQTCPLTRIIIAGKGPEAENLRRQAEYLGVSDKVDFVGFISDEERDWLFMTANCAVFPSLYEPFGIVALEAMVLECPVVVSAVGGLAEVVTHEQTGITTYPDNAESIAWGVVRALTRPDWTRKHVATAKAWADANFNWLHVAALTNQVYRQVLDQHAARQPVTE